VVRFTSGVQSNTIRFLGKTGVFGLPEVPGSTAFWDRAQWPVSSGRFWLFELRVSRHFSTFYGSSVQTMDTEPGAWHRRWTPMIHRGRARRTIAVRPTGGLQVTRQQSEAGRPAVADDEQVRSPCSNQLSKSNRKENTRQPQLCSVPAVRPLTRIALSDRFLPLLAHSPRHSEP